MSATSFLRQRRAVAAKYVRQRLSRRPRLTAETLERYKLEPVDMADLEGNNDVLSMADDLAKTPKNGGDELDALEILNHLTVGDRAAVHSPDVRSDQFEDKLQHPAAETVGVGNMHDGPQAAEAIANVSKARIDDNAGSLADATRQKVEEDPLANHSDLPATAPNLGPASKELTGDDPQPAAAALDAGDAGGSAQERGQTLVDREEAAEVLQQQEGEARDSVTQADGLDDMDEAKMRLFASQNGYTLNNNPRTKAETLRASLREQIAARPKGD